MPRPTLHRSPYGTSPEGRAVELWRLDSGTGVTAEVLTYGGILHSLRVPDTLGNACSVVLSLASVAEYAEKSPYFGALIGRYANRIAHGRFTLEGTRYHVPPNDRGHALHGGPEGFDSRIWRAEPVPSGDTASLRLSLHSPDGDMGFPGTLEATVAYALDPAGTLAVDYTASTDRPTVVNLTHHPYFNLSGRGGDVLDHTLQVEAGSYLPVDADGIPLGPLAPVQDTAFDLSSPRRIGDMLALPDPQLRQAGGYDHCWALRTGSAQGEPRRAARLSAPAQARVMEVWTTEPGLQVYTGNQLDGSLAGADGHPHLRHGAVCLETQHFPDSPNHSAYPATELRPGQILRSRTEYRFPHLAAPGERGERD
ncbi:aldose epimerase family protein [Actinacidiphila soli]|uniref:aldose epimerase family protein n=1 Tax=Actinacidiphila soli TaxID=2487275 RepID=UPI000FCB2C33|nr:aldose epimerase family protein [Actinacidiphila soli]